MTDLAPDAFAPAIPFITFDPDGTPYIEGHRCGHCQAVFTEPRIACGRCGARDGFTPFRASSRGVVHTFTVVYRSYPGIAVPFVSAIVDLDDGMVLKGTLRGVEPDPAAIPFGLPVKVIFDQANGQTTKEGVPYLSYFFTPATAEA